MSDVTKADKIPMIVAANEAMKAACEAYSEAVSKQIPTGTMVQVQHGRNWLGPYCVESVSSAWWSEPGRLYIRNIKTGKYRSAYPCQVSVLESDL